MDKAAHIKQQLQKVVGMVPNLPVTGTVREITGETCTVQLASDLKVTDVKLKSVVTGNNDQLLITPAEGSDVVMISADGSLRNLYVIKCDKVASWQLKTNELFVKFDGEDSKVAITNNQTSLFDLFNDLVTLLKQFKVYTPSGVSGTPIPTSITAIEQLETKFKQLLKQN